MNWFNSINAKEIGSVTVLNVIRCKSLVRNLCSIRGGFDSPVRGGFVCSVRNYRYHAIENPEKQQDNFYDSLDREINKEELNKRYNISWTKDYKNLNNLLSIKGLDSNKLIDENNIRYLVFSLANNKDDLSAGTDENGFIKISPKGSDIFYSVSLILESSGISKDSEKKKWLYKRILSKLQENSSLIKEGGQLDIYYVASSELEDNVKEGYRFEDEDRVGDGKGYLGNNTGNYNKKLIPSISEVITLNKDLNNQLRVNIYVFTCDIFFREYLKIKNGFYTNTSLDRRINGKLWAFPLLIIEEMTLSTVTYLFKEKELNLHGMSTTRRHKLSPLQKNLSNFLYITDLDATIQKTNLIYIDKIYTNNKIDPDLYKNIYEIHKQNYKTYSLLKEDIIAIKNILHKQIYTKTYLAIPSREDTKNIKFKLKIIQKLKNKWVNLKEHSISPKVIIFMLRNQIFDLELAKLSLENKQKDYLSEYNRINLEVDKIINENINIKNKNNIIIETLNSNVKNLELEILNLKKLVYDDRTEMYKNSQIIRSLGSEIPLSLGKSKRIKKRKKNETKLDSDRLNHKINLNEHQIKKLELEKKDALYKLDKKTREIYLELTTRKTDEKQKQKKLETSNLNLISKNKELDNLNEKLDLINNIPLSEGLVNSINNRKKKK